MPQRSVAIFLTLLLALTALACVGKPEAPPTETPPPVESTTAASEDWEKASAETPPAAPTSESDPASEPEPVPEPVFDPATVSDEAKTEAITDIRALIVALNTIIQRQDYEAWLLLLTPEYVAFYSNPVLLAQYSEYPVLMNQNVQLRTLKDYFLYLVYPSRQNDRVDDIEYVSENLVKAITVSPKGNRDILYILEKYGDTWKIGIGR